MRYCTTEVVMPPAHTMCPSTVNILQCAAKEKHTHVMLHTSVHAKWHSDMNIRSIAHYFSH